MTQTDNSFEPSKLQRSAIDAVADWYDDFSSPQVFRLFGYAGTGKTSIIEPIINELGLGNVVGEDRYGRPEYDVRLATFTGKAAHVLRGKLSVAHDAVSTIHRLIMRPDTTARELLQAALSEIDDLESTSEPSAAEKARLKTLRAKLPGLRREARTLHWVRRSREELSSIRLLILDEVSMINEELADKLMFYGIKMLVIGDPAQLPPIRGEGFFMSTPPDFLLDEVHRQALESAAIRVATTIRQSSSHGFGILGMDGNSGRMAGWDPRGLLDYSQVLCGTNKRRWHLIEAARSLLGHSPGSPPVPGDKVIVLRNDYEIGVFNGQMFTAYHVAEADSDGVIEMVVTDGTGPDLDVRVLRFDSRGFGGLDDEKTLLDEIREGSWGRRKRPDTGRPTPSGTVVGTFGWAVTTHKSQGSQWDSVLVIDESWIFGKYAESSGEDPRPRMRAWLYTAVTRAASRVVIAGRPS